MSPFKELSENDRKPKWGIDQGKYCIFDHDIIHHA